MAVSNEHASIFRQKDNSEKASVSSRAKALLSRATSPSPSSGKRTSASRSEASLNSLFSRLANKRRNLPAPAEDEFVPEAQEYVRNTRYNKLITNSLNQITGRFLYLTDITSNIEPQPVI